MSITQTLKFVDAHTVDVRITSKRYTSAETRTFQPSSVYASDITDRSAGVTLRGYNFSKLRWSHRTFLVALVPEEVRVNEGFFQELNHFYTVEIRLHYRDSSISNWIKVVIPGGAEPITRVEGHVELPIYTYAFTTVESIVDDYPAVP